MRSFEYGEQGNPDVFGDSNYDIGPDIGVGFDGPDDSDSPICGDIGVAIESPTCPSEVYLFLYFSLLVALVSSAFW
jgi:condensin-2 complex subunit H2